MPRTYLKLEKKLEREVPVLFPNTKVEVSSAEVEFYRSKVPFAFAIDRQSIPKSARKKDATGMRRRVEAITAAAEDEGVYLPTPHFHEEPIPGQLPYSFAGECRRFWMVDGTEKRATGYAANQNARPELWRAFLLAQALAEHGCGPRWFLVGEGTRLFREPQWLSTFCRALWHKQIRIFSGGFGEVTPDNYSGFEAYVKALSGWLKTVSTGARRVYREEHMLSHTRAPFGLAFSADHRHVFGHPEQWAINLDWLERLADGRETSCLGVSRYLKKAYGLDFCYAWVRQYLLDKRYFDGEYVCGDFEYRQRLVTQGGLFYDQDISEGGYARQLAVPREGLVFPIEHDKSGTRAPDPGVVAAARARVSLRRGRPRNTPSLQLWPMSRLKCAVGGYGIEDDYTETGHLPFLMCRCLDNAKRKLKISTAEAQALPQCQHVRRRPGRASDTLFAALFAGLKGQPLDPSPTQTDPAARQVQLEARLARAEAAFMAFQERCANGEMGDPTQPLVRRSIEQKRQTLMGEVDKTQRELELCCSQNLLAERENVQLREVALALAGIEPDDLTDAKKQELIMAVVKWADLNLETGEFAIHLNFSRDALVGVLPAVENRTAPTHGSNFLVYAWTIHGRLPERGLPDPDRSGDCLRWGNEGSIIAG